MDKEKLSENEREIMINYQNALLKQATEILERKTILSDKELRIVEAAAKVLGIYGQPSENDIFLKRFFSLIFSLAIK